MHQRPSRPPKLCGQTSAHKVLPCHLQSRRSVSPQAVSLRAKRNAAENAGGSVKPRGSQAEEMTRQATRHKQSCGERGVVQVRDTRMAGYWLYVKFGHTHVVPRVGFDPTTAIERKQTHMTEVSSSPVVLWQAPTEASSSRRTKSGSRKKREGARRDESPLQMRRHRLSTRNAVAPHEVPLTPAPCRAPI